MCCKPTQSYGHTTPRDASLPGAAPRASRIGEESRSTKETTVAVRINLDGTGVATLDTPVPFLNHMLD